MSDGARLTGVLGGTTAAPAGGARFANGRVCVADLLVERAGLVIKRSRRFAVGLAVAGLVSIAVWQLGQGAWIHAKARLAQHLLQRAWAQALAGQARPTPWPWADTWPVARLRAPAHGVDLIVLAGVTGSTLAFAPGHAAATAVPGTSGTAVITGHRDTHFRFLERVRAGDEVFVQVAGRPEARFVVRETAVLDSRSASIRGSGGVANLVLLTCYPFDAVRAGGPLRYAVVAN